MLNQQPHLVRCYLTAALVDHLLRALNAGDATAARLLPYSEALVQTLAALLDLSTAGLDACEAAGAMYADFGLTSSDYWRVLYQIVVDGGASFSWYSAFRQAITASWRLFQQQEWLAL
jgi:hypothetical protein